MKIEVTGVSVSKKGTVWLQAKVLEPDEHRPIKVGDVIVPYTVEQKKEEAPSEQEN